MRNWRRTECELSTFNMWDERAGLSCGHHLGCWDEHIETVLRTCTLAQLVGVSKPS